MNGYRVISVIGWGSTSTVWIARRLSDGMTVCLKSIPKESNHMVDREIRNFRLLKHPNIVKLYDVFEVDDSICIAMEHVPNGSLTKLLTGASLPSKLMFHIFDQILNAVEYLHTVHHIMHRDLKPENVMLDNQLNVKLVDFGFSKAVPNEPEQGTACGSPAFVAPEVIKREEYSFAADIWSIGIMLYMMATGTLPFHDNNVVTLLKMVVEDEVRFPPSASVDSELKELLLGILEKDPSHRLTIGEIRMSSWFMRQERALQAGNSKQVEKQQSMFPVMNRGVGQILHPRAKGNTLPQTLSIQSPKTMGRLGLADVIGRRRRSLHLLNGAKIPGKA